MNAYALPDEVVRLIDDTTVELILLQLGVRHRFEFPPNVDANALYYSIDDHPTHWILAGRFRGYPDPKDNGFTLVGWPKSQFSPFQAKHLAKEIVQRSGMAEPARIVCYRGEETGRN